MKIDLKLTKMDLAKLTGSDEKVKQAAGRVLREEGERILSKSKPEVPVDEGELRASGNVQGPTHTGTRTEVELGYNTPYAGFVHDGTKNMKGRKYLERPVNASANELSGRVGKAIKNALK